MSSVDLPPQPVPPPFRENADGSGSDNREMIFISDSYAIEINPGDDKALSSERKVKSTKNYSGLPKKWLHCMPCNKKMWDHQVFLKPFFDSSRYFLT